MFKGKDIEVEESSSGQESKIEQLERDLADARDAALRRTAELENMRRRHQQERTQLIFDANKTIINDLLTTIDDLERTLSHVKPEEKDTFVQGVELVYKNFLRTLEKYGVRPLESVGKHFDVELHDALMEEPRTDVEAGTITTEVTKGYMLNDSVLRHAKVVVAKAPETEEEGNA
jgi:molecular chaperone GrpE